MYNRRNSPSLGAYAYAFFGTIIFVAVTYWYSIHAMQGVIERTNPPAPAQHK